MLFGVFADGRPKFRFLTCLTLLQFLAGYFLESRSKRLDAIAQLPGALGKFARHLAEPRLIIGVDARKNRLGSVHAPLLERGEPLLVSLSFL